MTRAVDELVELPNPNDIRVECRLIVECLGLEFFSLFLKLLEPLAMLRASLQRPLQEVD